MGESELLNIAKDNVFLVDDTNLSFDKLFSKISCLSCYQGIP